MTAQQCQTAALGKIYHEIGSLFDRIADAKTPDEERMAIIDAVEKSPGLAVELEVAWGRVALRKPASEGQN